MSVPNVLATRYASDQMRTIWSPESKIVAECSYPLTGVACVSRIYTDLAVIDVTAAGLKVVETFNGLPFDELQRLSGLPLIA
jgi:3-oxoadipate CoA-transferase beta subunit